MSPKISVIIPLFNRSETIGRCLDSVFAQTLKPFEVIVVNDGSTDDFPSALEPYQNSIRLINQANSGAPKARNAGFATSSGDFVIFCDADILMNHDMLEKMFAALNDNPQAGYAYSSFRFGWKLFKLWQFDAKKLKEMPYITTTSLIRRECFPGFDESLKKFQDWDLWLTILYNGYEGVWIDEVLFSVITGGTMSNWLPGIVYRLPFIKNENKDKYLAAREIIRQKHNL